MNPPTLRDLCRAIGGRLAIDGPAPYGVPLGPIATDSRRVNRGDVFWALRGLKYDGNDYVGEAFERGAAGAVVTEPTPAPAGRWTIEVEDTQPALWKWARWKRRRFTGTLIAVTGSVGKTTTREMILAVLSDRFSGTQSPRNFNNHFGVPLSVLQIEKHHKFAVLELGASAVGEIGDLASIVAPDIGVVTAIALAQGDAILPDQVDVERIAARQARERLPGQVHDHPIARAHAFRARDLVAQQADDVLAILCKIDVQPIHVGGDLF